MSPPVSPPVWPAEKWAGCKTQTKTPFCCPQSSKPGPLEAPAGLTARTVETAERRLAIPLLGKTRQTPCGGVRRMSADEWARFAVRALLRRLMTQAAVKYEADAKELQGKLR